jgi:ATP-binding cassette subfamily C (CFTR/MRP) protein 1
MVSQETSCTEIDNTFQLFAQNCRDAFDFTLLFEQSILGLLPLALLLLVSPFRIFYLLPRRKKVNQSLLLPLKIVSLSSKYSMLELGSLRLITHIVYRRHMRV